MKFNRGVAVVMAGTGINLAWGHILQLECFQGIDQERHDCRR